MPKVEIYASESKLTENDIARVEDTLKIKFPGDYRNFLLENNGGKPDPNMFLIPDERPGQSSLLDWFYCIDPGNDNHIVSAYNTYKGRVPAESLPIGTDPGDNQICLIISGEKKGRIYFWAHEEEVDEGEVPTYRNMYLIADSLDDLLNNKLNEIPK